jgi:hypothetical protein
MNLDVPLADLTVEILRNVERRPNNNQVFGHDHKKLDPSVPGANKRIKELGSHVAGAHKRIDKHIIKAGSTPPPDWVIHDIRRTFRTKLAELGVNTDVAEALVGHVGHRTKMDRIYNRYKYWPEMRQALAKYEAHLRAIIDGTAERIEYRRFDERKKGGDIA